MEHLIASQPIVDRYGLAPCTFGGEGFSATE
jgi:hypothetical protein